MDFSNLERPLMALVRYKNRLSAEIGREVLSGEEIEFTACKLFIFVNHRAHSHLALFK